MSLKAELETWAAALEAYDKEEFDKAIQLFSTIADSSKILTNMGLIYATIGEHEVAVEHFIQATQLDTFLAVAYFQCGVSNFLLQRYDLAFRDFDGALLYLRGNENINYEQLGLKFKLYSAEVLFNKGLCQIYMGQLDDGLATLQEARNEKVTAEHNVVDDAIADRGDGYTVFSIVSKSASICCTRIDVPQPVGVLYRPSEIKLKNAKAKDYLGKAVCLPGSLFIAVLMAPPISEIGCYFRRERSVHHIHRCHPFQAGHLPLRRPSRGRADFGPHTSRDRQRHRSYVCSNLM